MSKSMGDRNLLLGILAWQKKFISRDALVAAMNAWALAKGKGLAQILREQKALTENQHALLEETVHAHLSRHGHDAAKSLAALSSVDDVKQELAKIADPDVQASLAQVSTAIPEVALEPLADEPILAEVVIEKPRDERPKKSVKKSPALDARRPAAVLRGGIPLWALVAGGAIAGGLVVVIVLMSIVLAVVLTRDNAPIAQVNPGDDPLKPGKEVDKGGDKPPVKDPVILKKENPPIDPEPATVDRKPTEVIGAAEWRVEAGELVVDNPTLKRAYLYFGSTQWTDYDFAFETNSAARLSGTLALFRLKDTANHYGLSLGTFQRKKHSLNRVEKGLLTYFEPHFEEPFIFNQWYAVRIEARGDQIRCFVDGKQVFDTKNSAHAQGQVALGATPEAKARWKNIKVTAPDGKVLWDGLPDLSGTKTTPPAAFVSLFNGKDLTGWKAHQTYGGNWRVENGILIGSAPAVGYLATTRDDFKDFHLRVEARFNDAGVGADGSVLFRSTLDLLGYETIINHPIKTTGNTYVRARGMLRDTGASSVPLPPGQWFTLELVAVGDRISIIVNGKTVSTIVDKNGEFSSGRITLHHRAKAVLEFRKIEIKELPTEAAPPVVLAKDFAPLFNGKDLTGWKTHPKQPGDWRVVDGILTGRGPAASSLYTVGGDYKNFHLRVETRINDRGVGAVFSRASFGPLSPAIDPKMPVGYRAIINSTNPTAFKTGGLFIVSDNKPIGGGVPQILPPGEWVTLEILADDKRLILLVNGKRTGTYNDFKALFSTGHIALNVDDPASVLEFRRIEIKALQPGDMPDEQRVFVAGELTPLFNGKDLTGWKTHPKQPGDWRVVDGILVGRGPALTSLYTERGDYKDFQLTVEARINAAGLGAVFARAPFGPLAPPVNSTSPLGFHARINNGNQFPNRTGSLVLREAVGVATTSDSKSKIPPGEWFTFALHVTNSEARVLINGRFVSATTDEKRKFTTGHIGLFLENPETVIEFRKIEIREMHHPDAVLTKPLVKVEIPGGAEPAEMKRFPFKVPASNMGTWRIENNELVHDLGKAPMSIFFGDPKWTDYDFSVDAMKVAGNDQFALWFRRADANRSFIFGVGARQGGTHMVALMEPTDIKHQQPLLVAKEPLQDRRWYNAKISVRGDKAACYLDGVKLFEFKSDQLPAGGVGLRTWLSAYRFKNIKVTAPDGTVLLEGLPDWVLTPNAVVPPGPIIANGEFVPLFNGKDLTGWTKHAQQPGEWRVVDGILTGFSAGNGHLFTTRGDYKDFHLRLEARTKDGKAGGVRFRYTQDLQGYETTLNSRSGGMIHIRKGGEPIRNLGQLVPVPADEWTTLDLLVRGNRLQLKVNGKTTVDALDARNAFTSGHICLYDFKESIEFRKIEIKEFIPVAAPPLPPLVAAEGFVPLFNGKDLTGWKSSGPQPRDWQVIDGVLTGSGPNLKMLYTPRDDYGDFHLRVEARYNVDALSSLAFRYPYGPAELEKLRIGGYAVRLNGRPEDFSKTGSLMVYEKVGMRHLVNKEPLVQAGQWFNLEIIAKGNLVTTIVNGKEVINYLNPKTHLMGGRIVLEANPTNRPTTLEYRRIDIKEFKAVAAPPQPPPERPLGEFVPVFNGKDLTGWRVEGNDGWKVSEAGELIGTGPDTALITKRTDYRNFIAKVELSASADVEAFFSFRETQEPGGKVIGLSSRLAGDDALVRAGYAGTNGSKFESGNQQIRVKPDEVFLLEFHVKQDSIRILANGKVTAGVGYAPDQHSPGAIGLHIAKGTVRIKKFEISAEAPQPVAVPFVPVGDFVPLFNGKDLAGWQPHLKTAGNWSVAKGVLIGEGEDAGILHTVRAEFKDYHLRMEARFTAPADAGSSGVLFRSLLGRSGYEIVFADGKTTGGLQLNGKDFGKSIPAKFPANVMAGDWLTLDFIAQGKRLTVQVNGKETTDFVDEEDLFKDGHIALRQGADCKAEFRKIEIRELKPAAPAPPREPPLAKGAFVPLFNAKDLTGWQPHAKRPGNWRVEKGILIGSAPIGGSLYSTRGDYQDFHLRAEVRINDKGFGRVFGRAAYDPNKIPFKVLGYEVLINQRPLGDKTGTLTATSLANSIVTQAKESPAPAGEWFLLEILAKGDLVTVKVNGIAVAEFRDDRRQYARSGHIALHQDANAIIEFRKVEIEDLSAP